MQQQRSQEDSYIHKRLIANINLGPNLEVIYLTMMMP